jgi:pentatricopeptide repeat protein
MGEFEDVLPVFDSMLGEGVKPDSVTFVVVFNVFSRLGLFSKGETLFEAMSRDYGILPCIEHQARMVNLLGLSGQLGKASSVIIEKILSFHPDPAIRNAILGSCRSTGNLELAEQMFNSGWAY